ncbi:hypothetical protein WICPIJ_000171 [Wickerhamomyces pijperi]|uniref:Uncharacterized protein n=1 Tax=Wickerhamomyces pijperi TaxID=599730 RepID=A0A9P8TSB2_WICPI|nr:hypothetical protein WICPIJ_000171 [Wickerhamomyces pijperi]
MYTFNTEMNNQTANAKPVVIQELAILTYFLSTTTPSSSLVVPSVIGSMLVNSKSSSLAISTLMMDFLEVK